jgi:predicted  nucleic acid-binding Zn-ribbon protein
MIKWFRTHKSLRDEIGRLKHQIKLMQEHIQAQKDDNLSLKKQIRELEMLWDIEMKKKY